MLNEKVVSWITTLLDDDPGSLTALQAKIRLDDDMTEEEKDTIIRIFSFIPTLAETGYSLHLMNSLIQISQGKTFPATTIPLIRLKTIENLTKFIDVCNVLGLNSKILKRKDTLNEFEYYVLRITASDSDGESSVHDLEAYACQIEAHLCNQ